MTSGPLAQQLKQALQHENLRAFLAMIRVGEGTADVLGYRRMFGGGQFEGFADHPRKANTVALGAKQYTSTAAGAYQFLARTWDECRDALQLPDFSPPAQDLAAAYLIRRRGALELVLAGEVAQAIAKCAAEWASLPGSIYGQPTRTMTQALASYQAAGGRIGSAPASKPEPAPAGATVATPNAALPAASNPKENTTMGASLLWGLAASLINVFTPLAREKITKEVARHTDNPEVAQQVANDVVNAARTLTGKDDPIDAVAAARQDPVALRQIEDQCLATIDRLAPVLDKMAQWDAQAWDAEERSRDTAAKRAAAEGVDLAPMLANWAVKGMFAMIAVLATIVVVQIIWSPDHKAAAELTTSLTALIMLAAAKVNTVFDYRFGSSRSSGAKDVVIGELSRRPGRRE